MREGSWGSLFQIDWSGEASLTKWYLSTELKKVREWTSGTWGISFPGREGRECQILELGMRTRAISDVRNWKETSVTGVKWVKRRVVRGEIKTRRRPPPPPPPHKVQRGLAVSARIWAQVNVINHQRKLTNETLNACGWEGGEKPEEWRGVGGGVLILKKETVPKITA